MVKFSQLPLVEILPFLTFTDLFSCSIALGNEAYLSEFQQSFQALEDYLNQEGNELPRSHSLLKLKRQSRLSLSIVWLTCQEDLAQTLPWTKSQDYVLLSCLRRNGKIKVYPRFLNYGDLTTLPPGGTVGIYKAKIEGSKIFPLFSQEHIQGFMMLKIWQGYPLHVIPQYKYSALLAIMSTTPHVGSIFSSPMWESLLIRVTSSITNYNQINHTNQAISKILEIQSEYSLKQDKMYQENLTYLFSPTRKGLLDPEILAPLDTELDIIRYTRTIDKVELYVVSNVDPKLWLNSQRIAHYHDIAETVIMHRIHYQNKYNLFNITPQLLLIEGRYQLLDTCMYELKPTELYSDAHQQPKLPEKVMITHLLCVREAYEFQQLLQQTQRAQTYEYLDLRLDNQERLSNLGKELTNIQFHPEKESALKKIQTNVVNLEHEPRVEDGAITVEYRFKDHHIHSSQILDKSSSYQSVIITNQNESIQDFFEIGNT